MKLHLQLVFFVTCLAGNAFYGQSGRQVKGSPAVEAIANEPPTKIFVDPPIDSALAQGRVVIQYRVDNLHLLPVFGVAAATVTPRVGHIHVSLDGAPWVWVAATGEPVILVGLDPGPHKVLLQAVTTNHQPLDAGEVTFTVPVTPAKMASPLPKQTTPAAKLVIDSPLSEPLSRGVIILPYRAENLRILPIYGTGALGITPPVGHIHVSVDGLAWHWADASGAPIIVSGLSAGPHQILVELVNATHQTVASEVIQVTVPIGNLPQTSH